MELIEKIKNKRVKISIIGLSYVGLPLATGFGKAGFFVMGFDISDACEPPLLKEI